LCLHCSRGGDYYFVTFIDDFFLVYKGLSHARFSNFHIYKTFVDTQIGRFFFNNSNTGGEYKYLKLNKFCDEHGIQYQFSTPYTPEQNGIVEQKKCT
jgi:hypothetical protein